MAARRRTTDDLRHEIASEREGLASAVASLREEMNLSRALRPKLPAIAAGAAGIGFVLAGGIGATMRLLARRGREGKELASVGGFSVVDHR